ncbi:MAG: hypothetical protein WCN81_04545, partial [Actinomycetes bacterium]
FSDINDRLVAEEVCRAYADFYTANSGDFPPDTQDSHYFERLKHAYPIHPEVFDRLLQRARIAQAIADARAAGLYELAEDAANTAIDADGQEAE